MPVNVDNWSIWMQKGEQLVTPAGFEPTTNRTGICHSIQLNYGAKLEIWN
jgi:hypothetical protein